MSAFTIADRGTPLTLTNEQTTAVSGRLRVLASAGVTERPAVAFVIAPGDSRTFEPLLGASRGVIAVESDNVLRLSSASLRMGHVGRSVAVTARHTAHSTGALLLALLRADVIVRVFASASSPSALTQAMFSSGTTEQMVDVPYANLIPAGMSLPDAHIVVEVLRGNAVVHAANGPVGRVRAVRARGITPPLLAVRGAESCEFRSGFTVVASSTASAAQSSWAVYGGSAAGSTDTLNCTSRSERVDTRRRCSPQ